MPTFIDENGQLHLGEATIFPKDLDELFELIETGKGNWVFTIPLPEDNHGPVLTWSMVKKMAAYDDKGKGTLTLPVSDFFDITGIYLGPGETLSISENELFGLLMAKAFDATWNRGQNCLAVMEGEKLVIWGQAVIEIAEGLKGFVK